MRRHRWLLPLDVLVGLFVLSALLLGTAPSYDPDLNRPILIGILAGGVAYFLLAHALPDWDVAYWIGRGVMLVGTAYAGLVGLQFAYQNWGTDAFSIILRAGNLTTFLPNFGIFLGHPNAAATFLESMIPFGVFLVMTSRRWILKAFWGFCTLICLYAIVLTFSRGAFVALGVTLLIAGMVLPRSKWVRLGALVLLVVGVAGLMLTTAGSEWVLSRFELYRSSLYVATDYLYTGVGLGETFPLIYSRYGLLIQVPFLTYAHNLILSVWMGQGLPGLVTFGLLIITFYRLVWRVLHSEPRRLFHAAWLGVTVTLVHGLFDSRHYVEALWLMPQLFGLIGLTAAMGSLTLYVNRRTNITYFPWRWFASAGAALVVAVVLFNTTLRAAWYTNMGALAETRAELSESLVLPQRQELNLEAQANYQHALELDPQWPNANRRSGNLYVKMEAFEQAVGPLEIASVHEPDNPAAIKGLGLAYVWTGRLEEAAALFHRLSNPREMSQELTVWGGWRGGPEKQQPLLAAYAYETAQLMYPDEVVIPYWLEIAWLYQAAGQVEQARRWYERVLAEEPGNETAQQAVANLN